MEELTLIFRREKIRFTNADGSPSETAMLECDRVDVEAGSFEHGVLTVKAECEPEDLTPGLSYRFYGRFQTHKKYGEQFVAKTFIRCQPHGQIATLTYLQQAPNVGPATARRLWDKFQGDAVRILREQPDVAAAAAGKPLTEEKAKDAAKWLETERAVENCTMDLMGLLDKKGFPKNTTKKALQKWGNRAAELIRRNPYLLMQLRGCGFKLCDNLYIELGYPLARMKRQALAAWYVIARDNDGHTWFSFETVTDKLRKYLPSGCNVAGALRLAVRCRMLAERFDGRYWYAVATKAKNEAYIAERVAELLAKVPMWPAVDGLDADEHQVGELRKPLSSRIGCYTGAPGTGKTYTVARLIGRIIEAEGHDSIAVAAPTGKAAARLSEALNSYGVGLRARTIHSLLGVASREDGEGWGFQHNEFNPLPFRFYVVDESSMPDTDIAAAFFKALPADAHVLFVGDTNQLPPVGHGAPLRDMLRAKVPSGELTKPQRQAAGSRIVMTCHAIRDGKGWSAAGSVSPETGDNLAVVNGDAMDTIVGKLKAIQAAGLADPIWDCQVIVAVNAKSPLARTAVNDRLQAEFNAAGTKGDGKFRTGDKIICLKNGLYPTVECDEPDVNTEESDGQVFAANGEIGRVVAVDGKVAVADFYQPRRRIKVLGGPEEKKEGEESSDGEGGDEGGGKRFDLAYGITCHKLQGSEAPVVFVVIDEYPGARMVCGREWLYTAISRAKRVCFLVGKIETARSMCLRKVLDRRKTFLTELIRERVNEQQKTTTSGREAIAGVPQGEGEGAATAEVWANV